MKYNLQELQSYYLENLINKSYVFETNIGVIVVKFNESNFCHLLGLHHFNPTYKGMNGWYMITSGEITHKTLKQINKKKHILKITCFYKFKIK